MKTSILNLNVAKVAVPAFVFFAQVNFAQNITAGTPITTNYIPMFSSTTTIKNSQLYDNGSAVIYGGTAPISGEHFSIQKNQNAATFQRIYNNTSGTAASTIYIGTTNAGSMSMASYNSSFTTSGIYGAGLGVLSTNLTNGMHIGTTNSADVSFWTNNTQKMTLTSGGLLGLNVTAPSQMLHMNNGAILVQGTVSGVGGANILIGGTVGTNLYGQYGIEYETAADVGYTYGGLNFWKPFLSTGAAGTNNILFLNDNGKVGVNTANPTANLTVNGTTLIGDPASVTLPSGYKLYVQTGILTEKVKVALINTTDWADYVFDKNYKLKPLSEVKNYVEENKHLPGVPSAQELKEQGGIDLSQMAAKQMEKIEELTLYLIQLEKQNKELNERLLKLEGTK